MSVNIINILELIIIAFIVYKAYKYITGTQAEHLLKGIMLLVVLLLLSKFFKLHIIASILESVINILIFGLVVIFQPELRRLLGYLGQPGILSRNIFGFEKESEVKSIIIEITEAIKHLSKSHIGALIVIKDSANIENYIEVGTKLDAQISTELILTIFHPNTPLHDGAVVISEDRIVAAGVLLPLTEDPKLSWQYGTRHRAAIGMSEISDVTCIVVSEETGAISMAQGGILNKFASIEELKVELEILYGLLEMSAEKPTKEQGKFRFNHIFSKEFSRFPGFLNKKRVKK
ncbi:MAG: diadenylate cyclase CdaA [bacterium]